MKKYHPGNWEDKPDTEENRIREELALIETQLHELAGPNEWIWPFERLGPEDPITRASLKRGVDEQSKRLTRRDKAKRKNWSPKWDWNLMYERKKSKRLLAKQERLEEKLEQL